MELNYPSPDLTDGTVLLRRWSEADVGCLAEASADPRIPRGTTVPAAFTTEAGLAFIRRQWGRAKSGEGISLAVADAASTEAFGSVVLMWRPQADVAGLGYWLIPRARGRGLATRAARLLTEWGLREVRLARVEAWVEPDNAASQRVLRAAGFQFEGVLRSFLRLGGGRSDAVVFSRTAEDAGAAASG